MKLIYGLMIVGMIATPSFAHSLDFGLTRDQREELHEAQQLARQIHDFASKPAELTRALANDARKENQEFVKTGNH